MEWKYRKEFQVMPGIKLQYGKNGIATTIKSSSDLSEKEIQLKAEKLHHQLHKPYKDVHEIKSASIGTLSSESLKALKDLLLVSGESFEQTQSLLNEKTALLNKYTRKLNTFERSLFKFLFKKKIERLKGDVDLLQEETQELNEQLKLSTVHLEVDSDDVYSDQYKNIKKAFDLLAQSDKKWDFTSSRATNQFAERTSASATITRSVINISNKDLPILHTTSPAMCFHNINGGDIYFYPGLVIIYDS